MADVNANINVNVNSSAALAGLKRLEQQIEAFQRSVSSGNAAAAAQQAALNRAMLDGINATGMFTAKQISAVDSVGKFTNSLEKNRLSLGEYTRYAGSQLPGLSRVFKREFDTMQSVATDRVKAINTQYLALGRTVDGVTSAIKSTPTGLAKGYGTDLAIATQRQQMFNKLIDDGSTKLLNWGKNTQWAGRQLMVGLSLPLAAFGAAAAAAFMELDKATVQLKRVYGDLSTTTAEVNANAEAIKNLGSEYTKYGIAVAETISIGARAAATGATNETLLAATEQTLRFATLGQIDYNQALDTTISLQTAFGVSNDDLASKIDFLNAVENQTILTIEDMSLAIPRVATVVRGLGGDVEDLAIMMTAMREGGVSAENAANGLKSGLASMINPTNRAKEMLNGLGINLEGIVKQYEGDLIGTIQAFGMELDKLSDMDRQRALEKTFGKYQYARMSALFDNMISKSGQAARAMDLAGYSMEDLASIADKELGTISESTTVKFQASFEQLKLAIAPLGEAFLKVATPAIELVTRIANAFNELPEPIKNAIGIATVAIAGIGPVLLMGIGLMGNLIANIIKGIQFFRKLGARVRGDSSAFQYMAKAELEALAATEALEANTMSLTGKLQLQAGAVNALTKEYGRFAAAAGIASGAMGSFPTGRAAAGGKGKPRLKMAKGGVVPGTGSGDTVPALLEPGETVITKSASKQYAPIIAAMNAGTIKGFEEGLDSGRQSSRESLVFAHGQAPVPLTRDQLETLKRLSSSAGAQQAERGVSLSNFGFATPEQFNSGQYTGKQAANLFTNKRLVDRTMYPMYEAIARELGMTTQQAIQDPRIRKEVRSFAGGIARNIYTEMGSSDFNNPDKKVGDQLFYRATDSALNETTQSGRMSASTRSAIDQSKKATTVGLFGGEANRESRGNRYPIGRNRQEQIFGERGQVSYKSQKGLLTRSAMIVARPFRAAVARGMGNQSPSVHAQEMVTQYVDGLEVGAKANVKDAARAGKTTATAYTGAVRQSVNATSGEQMTREQYIAQSSKVRRDAYNTKRMKDAKMTDAQMSRTQRRLERSKARPDIIAQAQSRKEMAREKAERNRLAAEERRRINADKQRKSRRSQRGASLGRGIGRAGGIVGMASMIPFMAQNAEGQFMGMDANMLGMGMMGASMLGPVMGGIKAGGVALAGAMGVSAGALAGIAAPIAAIGVTAFLLKKGMDNTLAAGKKYADSMTTSAKEQEALANLYGTQTYAEKRRIKKMEKLTGLTSEQQKQGKEFVATEQGQAMLGQSRTLLENNASGFAKNMATQLSQSVVAGAISPTQAKAMAAGLAQELGRADLVAPITAEIDQILAPNGDDIGAKPMQIQAKIQANLESDEAALERQMEQATAMAQGAAMGQGGSVAKLWSGDWDAATEASVAYYNTLVANSSSMYSSYLDQRQLLKDQIAELKNQIKDEEEKAKKIELQNELLQKQNELRGMDRENEGLLEARKQKEMNALRGNREAQISARGALNEMGIIDSDAMMHQMAMARERELGRYLTGAEREEFEVSLIVDLQTGRIDPQALQTLQTANERLHGGAENVVDTVVDLQATGDFETANQILQLTAQMPDEVLTVFNQEIEGMTAEQLTAYAEVMAMIPADVSTKIAVELAGMKPEDLKTFKEDLESLQGLGIDTGQLISDGGVEAITAAADGLKDMEDQLSSKKIQKGLKEIDKISSKDTKIRAKKVVELTTELQDAGGKPITAKQAQDAVQDILNKTGMTEEKFYSLPADVSTKVIAAQVNANAYKELAMAATKARNIAKDDPAEYAKQEKLRAMYYGIYQAYAGAASGAAASGGATMGMGGETEGGTTPPPVEEETTGGSGGGKKENPLTNINKGFIDQIKMYTNMNANMKSLNSKREDFVKNLTKGQGIVSKLRSLGLSEGLISNLASQGYDALSSAYKKYSKNKAGVSNQNALALQGTMAERIGTNRSSRIVSGFQAKAASKLQGRGLSGDQISSILEDPLIAEGIAKLGKKGGMTAKELDKLVNSTLNAANAIKEAERAADPLAAALEAVGIAASAIQANVDLKELELTNANEKAFSDTYGKSKEDAERLIEDNQILIDQYQEQIDKIEKSNDLNQREISLLDRSKKQWQDKIQLLQDQIDGYQKSIDAYQRENELRNQQASIISHSLEIMSKKEDDINKTYEARAKALDEVVAINQHIIQQQQSQLSIAEALSSGDIYAAAQAQQQMQAQNVEYSSEQSRLALDAARQNAISGLTTEGGLTRLQAEEQLAAIREQNYQNDLLITDLQNKIYTTNQAMIPHKQEIAKIDSQIADYNEKIYQNNELIYQKQTQLIEPLKATNAEWQKRLTASEVSLKRDIAAATVAERAQLKSLELKEAQLNATSANIDANKLLGKTYKGIANQIAQINRLLNDRKKLVADENWEDLGSLAKYENGKIDVSKTLEAIAAEYSSGIDQAVQAMSGASVFSSTGMATGGMVKGTGNRDSVATMLTPGEAVIRKSMVKKYGEGMFNKINQGSFDIPTYRVDSPSSAKVSSTQVSNTSTPVYNNTYSINVPVNQPNASADEIAYKVMTKIKNIDSASIRRVNGY